MKTRKRAKISGSGRQRVPREKRKLTPYDSMNKRFFSSNVMVESLLRRFIPPALIEGLDFGSLVCLSGEYATDEFRLRHSDMVWKINWKDGRPLYLLLMLEFQSSPDRLMALRILVYTGLLLLGLAEGRDSAISAAGSLPPVLPIVIYNGKSEWKGTTNLSDLFGDMPESLKAFTPGQRYLLIDENRAAEEGLGRDDGIFAQLVRFDKIRKAGDAAGIINDVASILQDLKCPALDRAFAEYFRFMAQHRLAKGVKLPPVFNIKGALNMWNDCFAAYEKEITARGKAEWKAEGRAEGRAEATASTASTLLQSYLRGRFGDASEPLVAALKGISDPDRLVRIADSAFRASSLAEVEALFAAAG